MKTIGTIVLAAAVLCGFASTAAAQQHGAPTEAPAYEHVAAGDAEIITAADGESGWKALAYLGGCLGAGVVVVGGGLGISRISSHALDSIARQPEAAGQMFMAWLIPAAMIEGATLFAVVVCLLVVLK